MQPATGQSAARKPVPTWSSSPNEEQPPPHQSDHMNENEITWVKCTYCVSIPSQNYSGSSKPNMRYNADVYIMYNCYTGRRRTSLSSYCCLVYRVWRLERPPKAFVMEIYLQNWQYFLWLQDSVRTQRCQWADCRRHSEEWLFCWNTDKLLIRLYSIWWSKEGNVVCVEC